MWRRLGRSEKEGTSFLKKRNKKLLLLLHLRVRSSLSADATKVKKVSWFFFSKKNAFLLSLILAWALPAQAADPVVAEQGSTQLTAAQVRALIDAADPDTRKKLAADPAALKNFITTYLLGQAVLNTAVAAQWDKRPDIAELAKRAHDSAIAQSFLAAQGTPPVAYPSDAEIEAAYTQNRAQLMQPRTYHLAQLFAVAPAPKQDAARRILADLRAQIVKGRFAFETAGTHAQGVAYGDLGFLPENRLQPGVKNAVAGLPEGQITAPVCTDAGCTLLKLLATRPAGPPPLADIRANLVHAMRQQKQRQLEQAYANSLLSKAPVRVDEIQLSHVTGP
jgi:peptidylprolyl isomerase